MARKAAVKDTSPDSLIAAAEVMLDKELEISRPRYKVRNEKWQEEAWEYYDNVGEIHYGINYKGNAYRRVRLMVAKMEEGEPVEVTTGPGVDALAKLRGPDGTHGDLLSRLGMNLEAVGEAHLVGLPDGTDEQFRIASNEELDAANGNTELRLKQSPGDREGIPLEFSARIWTPHPRFHAAADSSMRAILELCDELLILNRTIRSTARNRIVSNGILAVASEASFGPANPTTGTDNGNEREDPFSAQLMEAGTAAIENEGSAAAALPVIVRMKKELIESGGFEYITFDRPLDPAIAENRDSLIRRMAQGLDLPPEILLGMTDANHWTAWQVDDSTWEAHLDPKMRMMCSALTQVYLRSFVIGGSPDEFIWYDPAEAVASPDRLPDAVLVHDRDAISDKALREAGGFGEADAPNPEEVAARRAARARPQNGQGENNGPPEQASITASASPKRVAKLGTRLAAIDQTLYTKLSIAADAAAHRALEKAGAALRRKMGRSTDLKTIDQVHVASHIGRDAVHALGFDEAELLSGSADMLSQRYNIEVDRAYQQTLNELEAVGIDTTDPMLLGRLADAKAAGWASLESDFYDTMEAQLYAPDDFMGDIGESFDTRISPKAIRKAMATAGGAIGDETTGGSITALEGIPWAGLAVGAIVTGELYEGGIHANGFTWACGDPDRPFEPHQQLDFVDFDSFDDPVLVNDESWPDAEFYFPGDHIGCQCMFVPSYEV